MKLSTKQRAEGVLLGTAVGDLMGSPFEGYDITVEPGETDLFKDYQYIDPADPLHGWKPRAAEMIHIIRRQPDMLVTSYIGHLGTCFWKFGETTDDTAQTIRTAESMVARQQFDPDDISQSYIEWYDGGNGRGMGGTTALSLQLMDPQETDPPLHWSEASRRALALGEVQYKGRNHDSAYPVRALPSNGGLMRVSPVGVWFKDNQQERRQAAEDLTLITHAHQECLDTSRLQADLVALLMNGVSKDEALDQISEEYTSVIAGTEYAIAQPTEELGHGGGAYATLGVALDAFVQTDNFHDAIVSAINSCVLRKSWMCDVDTYGAVTGALAGACYGVNDIPTEWYELKHPNGTTHDLQPYNARYIRKLGGLLVRN